VLRPDWKQFVNSQIRPRILPNKDPQRCHAKLLSNGWRPYYCEVVVPDPSCGAAGCTALASNLA